IFGMPRYCRALLMLRGRMIDLDEFDLRELRRETQRQRIEARANDNDALDPVGECLAAARFDPKLAMAIVRHDAGLHQPFNASPHTPRYRPCGTCSEQAIL